MFFLLSSESFLIHSLLLTMMNLQGCPFHELGAKQLSLIISLIVSKETSLSSKSLIARRFTKRSKKSTIIFSFLIHKENWDGEPNTCWNPPRTRCHPLRGLAISFFAYRWLRYPPADASIINSLMIRNLFQSSSMTPITNMDAYHGAMSSIGAKVQWIPAADVSRAATRAACSTRSGSQLADCPRGIGNTVR